VDPRLLDIVRLAHAGDCHQALVDLREYLQASPEEVDAWVVLGNLAPDPKIRLSALRRALQLAPENAVARRAWEALSAQVTPDETLPPPPGAALPLNSAEPVLTAPTDSLRGALSEEAPRPVGASELSNLYEASPALAVLSDALEPTGEEISDPPISEDVFESPASVEAFAFTASKEAGESPYPIEVIRSARDLIWPFAPREDAPHTLGALLDAGRVTRQDLLWAAAEAHEAEVREVAAVLLATAHRLADAGMTLEDARLTAWPFRRTPFALGELVERGMVQVKDLRRASWFAKDPRVREAARILLPVAEERQAQRKAAKQAQSVQEPSASSTPPSPAEKPAKKPGKGKKSSAPASDADSKPTNDNSAAAARTKSLRQAIPGHAQARPMPIIQGSNYLVQEIERRYQRRTLLNYVGLGLAGVGILFVFYNLVVAVWRHVAPPLWVWPFLLVLVLPLFWLSEQLAELQEEMLNFSRGHQGEIAVARSLRQGLGGDWVLFRNVKLPGVNSDIDMVLLGPPGVFTLEVKTYAGRYRYHHKNFYRYTRAMSWRKTHHNPGLQARFISGALHQYIGYTLNQKVWVEPRLAWAGPGDLELQEPNVPVWFLERLEDETERLRALPARLSDQDRAALSGLLRGLCSTLRDY